MSIHPSDLLDLSRLGYQLLAIVSTDTDTTPIERQAREDSMFMVYTTHNTGHTYIWGKEDFGFNDDMN